MVTFRDTESRTVVFRGYREEGVESRVSVLKDGKTSGDWLPNNVDVLHTTESHT